MRLPPKWLKKPASKLVDAFRENYNAKHQTTLETSQLRLESKTGAPIDHSTLISDALLRAREEESSSAMMCTANFLIRAVAVAELSSGQHVVRGNPPILIERRAAQKPVADAEHTDTAAPKQSAKVAVKRGFLLRKTDGGGTGSTRRATTRRAPSPPASRAAGTINHHGAAGASGVLGNPADAFTRRCLTQAQDMVKHGAFRDALDMLGEAMCCTGAGMMEVTVHARAPERGTARTL